MFEGIIEKLQALYAPPPVTKVVDDREYAIHQTPNGPELGQIILAPEATALRLESLTGFIDAYNAGLDGFDKSKAIVHVIDFKTVALVSAEADKDGRRHEWMRAICTEMNPFPFDEYQMPEKFLISLQAGFLPTDNVINLQRLASSLTNENSIATKDDGLSQTVTVKQGAVTRDAVDIPPRIALFAYRTFREIDPITSDFLVRLKGVAGQLPHIALLQVDAGRWKHDTMRLVKGWLSTNLPEATIIA